MFKFQDCTPLQPLQGVFKVLQTWYILESLTIGAPQQVMPIIEELVDSNFVWDFKSQLILRVDKTDITHISARNDA